MLSTKLSGQSIRDESSTPGPVPQRGAGAEFSVGLRSFPYLADHGVRDLVVLPGSFYVDLALSEHRKRFRHASATVRNAIFQNPIILSNDDTRITVKVTDCGTFVEYVFYEHSAAALSSGVQPKSAAQLEIHPLKARSHERRSDSYSVESFQATGQVGLDGKQFYETLRANGNRYGRHFQQLTSIWRDQNRVLAGINVPRRETESAAHACRPILLDVATQLLSAFTVEQGQTFILRSIQRIDIADLPYPDRLWAHATWLPDSDVQNKGSVGHVRVVDDAGRTYLELSGVRLTFLAGVDSAARRALPKLCIAATFTAEPTAESLNFWADQFGTPIELTFSPYNQIFQQLLDPESAFHQNADGANVILLELESWAAEEPSLAQPGLFDVSASRGEREGAGELAAQRGNDAGPAGNLEQHVDDFCGALRSFMRRSKVPLILGFCPASRTDPAMKASLDAAEERLAAEVAQIAQVHTIRSASVLASYRLGDYADPHSHQLDHIPYTPEGYAAIGTSLFRAMFNLKQAPYKVIVLDCDNTLWKGVCGEDGPLGLEVTPPYRALQEFMVEQTTAGRLLCLCSKNNESDVLDVFKQRTDMVLREEHFVSHRINWSSKSENLKSLARELNLGLESFILVDDNPVECNEVETNCPGVLTLQLPENADGIPAFLDNIWVLDCATSTAADRDRTRMYQQDVAREKSRTNLSLNDFIKGLQLRVAVTEPAAGDLDRVAQLTFRTNQFNFTTIRRSEIEVRGFLARPAAAGLVVRVSDRFGEYGLAGVVLYERDTDRYRVDTFLLSCRVLGRGVEHAIIAALAQRASAEGKPLVEFAYVPTAKNAPAIEFLRSIEHLRRDGPSASWVFAAEDLVRLQYRPDRAPIEHSSSTVTSTGRGVPRAGVADVRLFGDIAHGRLGPVHIANRLSSRARSPRPIADTARPAATALERRLCEAFARHAGVDVAGVDDSFFELGGTSLQATLLVNELQRMAGQTFDSVPIFEHQTPAALAAYLEAKEPAAARALANRAAGHVGPSSAPADVSVSGTVSVACARAIDLEALDDDEVARLLDALTTAAGRRGA